MIYSRTVRSIALPLGSEFHRDSRCRTSRLGLETDLTNPLFHLAATTFRHARSLNDCYRVG